MRQPSCLARLFTTAAVTALLAAGLSGCKTAGMSDVTGSLGAKAEPAPAADPTHASDVDGDRFRANPRDADAALRYGQALRANGQRSQAVAVFEQASLNNPGNKTLLAAYGRALADRCGSATGFAARCSLSLVRVQNAMHISSVVCSPQVTSRGLAMFGFRLLRAELS